MKLVPLLLAMLCAPALAQTPPAPPPGEALFKERCALCHMEEDDSAPSAGHLKTLEAAFILDKLDNGTMQPMAAGLTPEQKKDIVSFLTTKSSATAAEAKPPQ